jgi:hypothetical protein
VNPDRATPSHSRVHVNCKTAQQWQSDLLVPLRRIPPETINQGSVWESIAKMICPAGTYNTTFPARPIAPLK